MEAARHTEESHFATHDGTEIFFRHWPAPRQPRRGGIVLLHRGHEHSGRMAHLVDELDLPDFDFFAWDARGHGLSPGERGYSPSIADSVRDLQTFVDHIDQTYGIAPEDLALVAQSVGAVLAAVWVHDYAPKVRCMVLASPAFRVKLYVPLARPALRLWQALRGNFFVESYVKAGFLTRDPERQASYDSDPLISRAISANILLGLYEAAKRVVEDAQATVVPTQLLISGLDWVVHLAPQHDFYENLGATVKERHLLKNFYHDTFGELEREQVVDKARNFLVHRFAALPLRVALGDADLRGPTRREADALARPLPTLSPKGLYWAAMRLLLRSLGRLSAGVRLGHITGFDSGATLDYVYRNKPSGWGFLGRLIDHNYLNAIGWRGIRRRKQHLEEFLLQALELLAADERPLRVLDVAAGHGRYLLEALAGCPHRPESVLLRDVSPASVREGAALIRKMGMQDIARFEAGDAFDRDSLAAIRPRPTVAIVSGLYELFPENDRVRLSLAGLARAIEPGGYLIYTGQPWHPQLEFIARTLTSHRNGQPWVMRRRSQAEMDQLVENAGFVKLAQRIDSWGIFTVSLARRLEE